jgi:zinc transport system substrate-binding protein
MGSMGRKSFSGIAIAVLCAVFFMPACSNPSGKSGPHKMKVITTLFPLYDMARYIGNGSADVSLLLPPGVEAHSFDPKPSDIVRINEADIFVYTGKFMEPWAEDIVRGVSNKKLLVVDASKGTRTISDAGSVDPHIWLDFDNAKVMAKNIGQAFEAGDPANREQYAKRTEDYCSRLTGLDSAYRTSLAACKSKEIVYGGHYAFGYLVRRYGLSYLAAQGVSPDAEPTANDLVRLVDQIRKNSIRFVFYEELSSPRIAETIAAETSAKLLLLNAAHNVTRDQIEKGTTFFDIMKTDLDNLKTGLGCR